MTHLCEKFYQMIKNQSRFQNDTQQQKLQSKKTSSNGWSSKKVKLSDILVTSFLMTWVVLCYGSEVLFTKALVCSTIIICLLILKNTDQNNFFENQNWN